jgi:hypothetical protein
LVTVTPHTSAERVVSFQFYLVGAAEIAAGSFYLSEFVGIIYVLAILYIVAGFWIGKGNRYGGILGGALAVVGLVSGFYSASASSIVSNSIVNLVLITAVAVLWTDLK